MRYLLPIAVLLLFFHFGLVTTIFAQNTAIRFFGTGTNGVDRITIPLKTYPTLNLGQDITIEWWMKASISENISNPCQEQNDGWIVGNTIFDRDIYGVGDYGDFGISIANGKIAFGVHNGSSGITVCGTTIVTDGTWNHIAVTRNAQSGILRIFVNGILNREKQGPIGRIDYNVSRSTSFPFDPYFVIGAEKHDEGSEYPSYNGLIDELRISSSVRYTTNFTRPINPFTSDNSTVTLFHFDEANGTTVVDDRGQIVGTLRIGGSNQGPQFIADPIFSTSSSKKGDANNDDRVNGLDYVIWLVNFSRITMEGVKHGDFNTDGVVNGLDYIIWLTNFGL